MFIQTRISMVKITVDGITATMNRHDAMQLQKKYPHAKIKPVYQKGRSSYGPNKQPSPVRNVSVADYLATSI